MASAQKRGRVALGKMNFLNELEKQVLDKFVCGDDPNLDILRKQIAAATVTNREFTGVGFFTKFHVRSRQVGYGQGQD